ncbi:flavin reductase family protein [Streptomyces sp. NPDC008196]|uniref:flavin reductase family protein n=1 Tax=Streptomyces sp. NPDC008196 TaxID=3364819 RepID=UPI0036E27D45
MTTTTIAMEREELDAQRLRQAFGCFPGGVTAVASLVDGEPVGMAVSSFTSVSMAPPLVSVCMQDSSSTWPKLRDRPRLGLSVLAEDQHEACRKLSSKNGDRFAGVRWQATSSSAVAARDSDSGAVTVAGAAEAMPRVSGAARRARRRPAVTSPVHACTAVSRIASPTKSRQAVTRATTPPEDSSSHQFDDSTCAPEAITEPQVGFGGCGPKPR